MFVHNETYLTYDRSAMLIYNLTGYLGSTVASCVPETVIACVENFASAMLAMENNLASNGFTQLEVLSRGTVGESVFQDILDGNIRTHVFTSNPTNSPIGKSPTLSSNKRLSIAERYYKFGDSDTLPIYFKVSLGFIGTAVASSNKFARPFVSIEFYSSDLFISPIHYWQSNVYATYDPASPGTGSRPFAFCYAANNNNLVISFGSDQGGDNNDITHAGYNATATYSPARFFRPVMFSKAHAPDVDLGEKTHLAMVHIPIITEKNGSSNGEDAITLSASYMRSQNYPPVLLSPISNEQYFCTMGIPRTSNSLAAARVTKPFVMDYFIVSDDLGVVEFDGLMYAPILDRHNFGVNIGTHVVRGVLKSVYQMPMLMISSFEYELGNWKNRAHTISLVADE